MPQTFASNTLIQAFAWHVYPDPAGAGVMVGDHPFGADEPPGPDRGEVKAPPGVERAWLIGKNTPGIHNLHEGHSYLVLTETEEPPPVTPGWLVEPARLDDSFQLDQRGDRWIRILRTIDHSDSPLGPVAECEFQIDRS